MGWLIAVLIILTVIYFSIISPGFRKGLFGLIGLVVVAGLIYYSYERREERAALSRVSQDDLEFTRLGWTFSYSDDVLFSGVVRNRSRYEVTNLVFRLELFDCPTSAPEDDWPRGCASIGLDDRASTYASIPPEGSRQFEVRGMMFHTPEVQGSPYLQWGIEEVRANEVD
ncbi:hypothetical protein [Parasphingopyxis marina]|uniref:Uncharacterized protein n=1 Tax=Parasphingopyxis marina TaxID=2761622 RepID=A0A842I051_9SPHN|nr:hypothetical protein [Parasphingopyxis marina]MBC2777560.1 hypothetical protein [Parasphingopyxis marina]